MLRGFGWGIADQALSSASNFILGIAAARSLPRAGFGAFGIAYATYTLALVITRAFSSEPLTVRFSGDRFDPQAARAATGATLLVSGGFAVMLEMLAPFFDGPLRVSLVVLGLSIPGLLVQDVWRYAFFASGRSPAAVLNDAVWAIVQLGCLLGFAFLGGLDLPRVMMSWGIGAACAAVVGGFQSGVHPSIYLARSWWRMHKDLAGRFVGERVSMYGANYGIVYLTSLVGGLTEAALIRAGQLLIGPLNVLNMGLGLAALPQAAAAARRSIRSLIRVSLVTALVIGIGSALWGVVVLTMPEGLGTLILGDSWVGARFTGAAFALYMVGAGTQTGALIGLRALEKAQKTLPMTIATGIFVLLCGIIGTAIAGARGASLAVALAMCFASAGWWLAYLRIARLEPTIPA